MTEITLMQVDADLARLNQYNLALEGFQRVMEGREVITGPTAMAMRIALEDAEVDQSVDQGITGKDLVAGFKKVAITVRNIIQWLLRTIGKLVETIGLAMQKLGDVGRKQKVALKAVPEQVKTELPKAKVEPSSFDPSFLSIAGEFAGHDVEQLNNMLKMVQFASNDYPVQFDHVLADLEQLARTAISSKADSTDAFFNGLGQSLQKNIKIPQMKYSNTNHMPHMSSNSVSTVNTVPLLGDQGLTMLDPQDAVAVLSKSNPISALQGYLLIKFGEYDTSVEGEVEVKSPDYPTLVKLNEICIQAAETWNEADKSNLSKISSRVEKIKGLLDDMAKGEQSPALNTIASAMGVVLQRMTDPLMNIQKWVSRTLKAELSYIQQCVDAAEQE
ncbi:hypothetical protein MZD04_gp221 [Pseudomonas phage Psa21]|uniref:Virion structural protein n=1 Tax=Pseudomonas phage Psa21 TaxID=2530023 RepID=A0A481W6B8_9CAUD|nr:hypothetical protein MZD04_gp221 [Pseudomonas phage Psa21]QBJ02747.1 hypothetical protein PSA21_221 [Pseudomonas phage Psa21]